MEALNMPTMVSISVQNIVSYMDQPMVRTRGVAMRGYLLVRKGKIKPIIGTFNGFKSMQ